MILGKSLRSNQRLNVEKICTIYVAYDLTLGLFKDFFKLVLYNFFQYSEYWELPIFKVSFKRQKFKLHKIFAEWFLLLSSIAVIVQLISTGMTEQNNIIIIVIVSVVLLFLGLVLVSQDKTILDTNYSHSRINQVAKIK